MTDHKVPSPLGKSIAMGALQSTLVQPAYVELAKTLAATRPVVPEIMAQALSVGRELSKTVEAAQALAQTVQFKQQMFNVTEAHSSFVKLAQQMTAFVPPWVSQVQAAAASLDLAFRPVGAEMSRLIADLRPTVDLWSRHDRKAKLIEAAGWLPHYTTPWDQLDDTLEDPEQVGAIIDQHYAENWRAVRKDFTKRLRGYAIDDDAKSLFGEALTAHRRGHHRSCIRALFPEIERLARENLPPAPRGGPIAALTGAAGDLYLSDIEPRGFYALELFSKLESEAYANVWTDEEAQKAASFTAPSRHAAVHGRVAYANKRSSMNALIMADTAFQIISVTNTNLKQAQATAA